MTIETPIPKLLLRPITTGVNNAMDQSELALTQGAGKNRAYTVRLVLVLVVFSLVDKQARDFFSQSLSVAIAIVLLLQAVI